MFFCHGHAASACAHEYARRQSAVATAKAAGNTGGTVSGIMVSRFIDSSAIASWP